MRHLAILAFSLTLSACAGEMAMQSVSRQSAGMLNQYRGAFRDFAQRQNESNAIAAARIRRLNGLRDERTSEIQSRTRAWRIVRGDQGTASFSTLTANDAAAIVAALDPPPENAPPALRFDTAPVDATIKQLIELQRPRTATDRARDFLEFAAGLRASYDSAVSEAAEGARDAGTATADNTTQNIHSEDVPSPEQPEN